MAKRKRRRVTRYSDTVLFAAMFAFVVVVVNAYTRVSGSRGDCPVWYDCYGRDAASTVQDMGQALTSTVILSHDASPWEIKVDPYLAAVLAIVTLRLAYLGWQMRQTRGNYQFVAPLIVFVLLLIFALPDIPAAALLLEASAATVQFFTSLAILILLWWLAIREQRVFKSARATLFTRAMRPRVVAALVIIGLQMLLGLWLSASHVGLPCIGFPTCQGSWWPPMDLVGSLSTLGSYGFSAPAGSLDLPVATAIHMLHRAGALIALLYVGWLAMHLFWEGIRDNLCRYGLVLIILLLAEIALGIMAVVMQLPIVVSLAHSAVGTLLLLSVVTLYHAVRRQKKALKAKRRIHHEITESTINSHAG